MVGAKASAHNLTNRKSFVLFAVKCTVNARKVTISGKKGEVTKDFSHIACELKRMKQSTKKRNGTFIRIRIWFGGAKQACAVNTLKSSIGNMCIGVTEVSNTSLLSCFASLSLGTVQSVALNGLCFGLAILFAILIINYTSIGRGKQNV